MKTAALHPSVPSSGSKSRSRCKVFKVAVFFFFIRAGIALAPIALRGAEADTTGERTGPAITHAHGEDALATARFHIGHATAPAELRFLR